MKKGSLVFVSFLLCLVVSVSSFLPVYAYGIMPYADVTGTGQIRVSGGVMQDLANWFLGYDVFPPSGGGGGTADQKFRIYESADNKVNVAAYLPAPSVIFSGQDDATINSGEYDMGPAFAWPAAGISPGGCPYNDWDDNASSNPATNTPNKWIWPSDAVGLPDNERNELAWRRYLGRVFIPMSTSDKLSSFGFDSSVSDKDTLHNSYAYFTFGFSDPANDFRVLNIINAAAMRDSSYYEYIDLKVSYAFAPVSYLSGGSDPAADFSKCGEYFSSLNYDTVGFSSWNTPDGYQDVHYLPLTIPEAGQYVLIIRYTLDAPTSYADNNYPITLTSYIQASEYNAVGDDGSTSGLGLDKLLTTTMGNGYGFGLVDSNGNYLNTPIVMGDTVLNPVTGEYVPFASAGSVPDNDNLYVFSLPSGGDIYWEVLPNAIRGWTDTGGVKSDPVYYTYGVDQSVKEEYDQDKQDSINGGIADIGGAGGSFVGGFFGELQRIWESVTSAIASLGDAMGKALDSLVSLPADGLKLFSGLFSIFPPEISGILLLGVSVFIVSAIIKFIRG